MGNSTDPAIKKSRKRGNTIFISHALADRYARFLIGVLKNHDLGQFNTQSAHFQRNG